MNMNRLAALVAQHSFAQSTALVDPAIIIARARDMQFEFDQATRDSTGAFLIGQLERLDPKLHEPLINITWSRDIDQRTDVTVADETSSFTNSSFSTPGGLEPGGKNWAGTASNAISGISLDIGKTPQPLHLWAMEIAYTLPELAKAIALGQPIDQQKFSAMQKKHSMDTDEQVYIGDSKLGAYGLVNSPLVTVTNVTAGVNGNPWSVKTADEILSDVNLLITTAWTASAYNRAPNTLLLPPVQYSKLVTKLNSTAGSASVLKFLSENSLSNQLNGTPLNIYPTKWLAGRGVGGTDRAIAYTKDEDMVRFPMTPLQRTPVEFRSLYQMTTYWGRLGQVEWVYPETGAYLDGI